jgi:outer membrane receptor protein involved in Fe transport
VARDVALTGEDAQTVSRNDWRITALIGAYIFASTPYMLAQSTVLRGTVVDPSGAVVQNAPVNSDCATQPVLTTARGEFTIECQHAATYVAVSSPGFLNATVQVTDPKVPVRITLALAPRSAPPLVIVQDSMADSIDERAQSITHIPETVLLASPQPTVDDTLRNVAGFSLFRRSGSRVANPTSQGVSLRGIGASGASRALVLYDEIPLNDPFGGWVYWSRVTPEVVSAVEVLQGGGSDYFGDQALAGVIKLSRRAPEGSLRLTSAGGSMGTFSQSASGGWVLGPVHASGFFDLAATDGYVLVTPSVRGTADTPANARHSSGELRLEADWKETLLFIQGSGFGERRHNGTPLQNNDTRLFDLAGGLDRRVGRGNLVLRFDGGGQSYNQSFSSIASDRDSESLARLQHVPAQQFGARAVWGAGWRAHQFSFGGDVRQIRGLTEETIFAGGAPSSNVFAGGRQIRAGGFIQDAWKLSTKLTVAGTLRFDGWRNYQASSLTLPVSAPVAATISPDRSENAFDPRLSVVYRPGGNVSLFATGYRSFRAPRLNELYRAFRLGNVLTLANPDLKAERLGGVDAGIGFDRDHAHLRATFFFAHVSHPVANVTLTTTPALITRQRQNAGALESKGVQLTGSVMFRRDWTWRGDYQFADSTITQFDPNPVLVGKRVPQVPKHSVATSLLFQHASWTASLSGRVTSQQFDDDLNAFDLGRASSFDLYAARRWNDHVETFFSAENLLDQRDFIARTPTPNLGLPFSARVGIRITIGREPVPAMD